MHGIRIFIITVSYAFIAINIFKVYRKQKTLKLNAINLEKKKINSGWSHDQVPQRPNCFFMEDFLSIFRYTFKNDTLFPK